MKRFVKNTLWFIGGFAGIVAVALLMSSDASAKPYAVAYGAGGVEVYLGDHKATVCPTPFLEAVARNGKGEYAQGCWITDGKKVLIKWVDGDLNEYDVKSFTPLDKPTIDMRA